MDEHAAIPGSLSAAAKRLRWRRVADGPAGDPAALAVRRYAADAADGELFAFVSRDPVGVGRRLLWHLSVSFCDRDRKPSRLPTWDELKSAKYQLIPDDVVMILIFPRKTAAYVNLLDSCLHLWQADDDLDL